MLIFAAFPSERLYRLEEHPPIGRPIIDLDLEDYH